MNLDDPLVETYVQMAARHLWVSNAKPNSAEHNELTDKLDAFKKFAELTGADLDYGILNQMAIERFVTTTGCSPSDINNLSQDNGYKDLHAEADIEAFRVKTKAKLDKGQITLEDIFDQFELFCATCIKITYRKGMGDHTADKRFGPLILNTNQKKFMARVIDDFFNKKIPVRGQVLKSRQLGFTTVINAFELWLMFQLENFTVMFIIDKDVHLSEKRNIILGWIEDARKLFPDLPGIKRKGPKVIELTNGSRMLFESAMAPHPGTSEKIDFLHMSERTKYPRNRSAEIKGSIYPGVPDEEYTVVLDESTAEGEEDFKLDWVVIHQGQQYGKAKTIPYFFPWFTSDEYQEPPPQEYCDAGGNLRYANGDDELSELDGEGNVIYNEQQYAERYDLTDSQIFWRRTQIKGKYKGDKSLFDQEYPTTPEHAWSSAGMRYINAQLLKQMYYWVRDPIFIGDIEHAGCPIGSLDLVDSALLLPSLVDNSVSGKLKIWKHPVAGERYFIGGDVAEGKQIPIGTKLDPDWTVAYVIDETGADCAIYRARCTPEEFPLVLVLLGVYYNFARINCERNKDGATVWSRFKNMRYPNIYYRTTERGQLDDLAWSLIGPGQRKPFLNVCRLAIREDPSRVKSLRLCKEAEALRRDKSGKVEPVGEHDDVYMARAHADVCRRGVTGEMLRSIQQQNDKEEEEKPAENTFGALMEFNKLEFVDAQEVGTWFNDSEIDYAV